MINNKLQNIFICKILHIYTSLWSFHLKYWLNLRRQNFKLKIKSFKASIFILQLRGVRNLFPQVFIFEIISFLSQLSIKVCLFEKSFSGLQKDSVGFGQGSANFLGSNRILLAHGRKPSPPPWHARMTWKLDGTWSLQNVTCRDSF